MAGVFKNASPKWLNNTHLVPSLFYAVHSIPFYKQQWDGMDLIAFYKKLSPITKATFLNAHEDFENPILSSDYKLYSSGYLSGLKTEIKKSKKEEKFLREYLSNGGDVEEKIYNIYLIYTKAGDFLSLDDNLEVINLLSEDFNFQEFKNKLQKLSKHFALRVIGLESQLRLFAHTISSFCNTLNIYELVSAGDILTDNLKNLYKTICNASVCNRYGITEIFAGATECPICGLFHFDPYVIYDVDDFYINEQNELIGSLLLSSTYPFNQKTFFIKYKTGDIVKLMYVNECCEYGFKLIGREKNTVRYHGRVLFSTMELYNELSNYAQIATSKLFANNKCRVDPSLLGHLRFNFEVENKTIIFNICVKDLELYNHAEREILAASFFSSISNIIYIESFDIIINLHNENSAVSAFLPDEVEI